VSAKWPRWFTASCISNPSSVRRSGMAITPALLTRMSILGWPAAIWAAASRTERWDARSSDCSSSDASGTSSWIDFRAASALPWSRAAITTWPPLRASSLATSSPRPPLAPVTTATRPDWSGMSAAVQAIPGCYADRQAGWDRSGVVCALGI
jgi:hypothetical protein